MALRHSRVGRSRPRKTFDGTDEVREKGRGRTLFKTNSRFRKPRTRSVDSEVSTNESLLTRIYKTNGSLSRGRSLLPEGSGEQGPFRGTVRCERLCRRDVPPVAGSTGLYDYTRSLRPENRKQGTSWSTTDFRCTSDARSRLGTKVTDTDPMEVVQ